MRSRLRRDDGASLAFVMIFVMGVGLVVAALLGYAQTGIASAKATQSRQSLASDASGAMDVAINSLRYSQYADSAQSCDPYVPSTVPGTGGQTVRIVCQPKAGTGIAAGIVPITKLNSPGSAVLTLGTSALEAGLAKGSNGILRIKGRVYVNSNITVAGSACPGSNCSEIDVDQAPVVAKTGCTAGRVVSTVSVNCAGTGNPPEGKDPALLTNTDIPGNPVTGDPSGSAIAAGYTQPPSTATQLVHRIVPATCPAGLSVEFDPGYYDDAAALTNLSTSCTKPFHFKPGVYYFDFRNEEVAAMSGTQPFTPGMQGNVWTINNPGTNFYVVGGTETAWAGGSPTAFPGSCASPLTTTTNNQGVQFVFGGSSRINVAAGKVELCGQYSTNSPALVIYGAKTGTTVQVPPQASTATAATTPIAAPDTPFTSSAQAFTVDGSAAKATIMRPTSNTTATASERLTGMNVASQIPAGSILVSAELRVTHKESASRPSDALTVSLLPNPGRSGTAPTASSGGVAVNASASFATGTISLTDALAKEVWQYGLSDLRMDYTVTAGKQNGSNTTFVADLDAVQLYLSWKPPSLRGESTLINGANSVGAVPPATSNPLILTNGTKTSLYLQGTTYAPLATFNINLTNVSGQVFKSGVIARSISVSVTPSAGFVGPVIEVPDETGSGVSLDVYLSAYVCTTLPSVPCSGSPPSTGWRRVGRSTITLFSGYPVPSNGKRSVTVSSWNLLE
jgi:type II secretory pathway pseudopilin PulG